MKKLVPSSILRSLIVAAGAIMIISLGSSFTTINNKKHPVHYSIEVSKNVNNRKHKVSLSTDGRQEAIAFSVNGMEGDTYQLYMFDLDNKLVAEAHIRNREMVMLNGVSKGNYTFEVLVDDEKIESGSVMIR